MAMAGIGVTLFLGGYLGPFIDLPKAGPMISLAWFFAKFGLMIALNIWVRGTWPRIRVDQLLGFAWKILLPMSLINIVAAAIWHFTPSKPLAWVVTAALLALSWIGLTKFSASQTIEKRTYRYADQ
jgi:NADH-quinone oxidoreductase subunit H